VIEAPEVQEKLVANALIAEIGRCVAVAVAVAVADYRDQAVVVEVAESGCWFERMHLSSGVAAEEVDVFFLVTLMDIANPTSRH
jgi:hypothetical protein